MNDRIPEPKGTVNIQCYVDGKLAWEEEQKNLVVTLGRTAICHLINGDFTNRNITSVGFGTGSAATAITDTALTNETVIAISSSSYPNATSVKFNFTLGTGDANGKTITELGLKTAAGVLFSRMIRGAIIKTNAMSLVCTWTMEF